MRITSLYGLISFWGLMNFEKEMLNSLETQSIVQFSCRFLPRFQKPLKKRKDFPMAEEERASGASSWLYNFTQEFPEPTRTRKWALSLRYGTCN